MMLVLLTYTFTQVLNLNDKNAREGIMTMQ